VYERGEQLRKLAVEDLKRLAIEPPENIIVESRPATISVIVQPLPSGSVRVVVQGFLKALLLGGKHVALDGIYKLPDGTVSPMHRYTTAIETDLLPYSSGLGILTPG